MITSTLSSSYSYSYKSSSATATLTFATPKLLTQRRLKINRPCFIRADLSGDAPFAVAIGACIVSSLLLPKPAPSEDDDEQSESLIDTADARFAVMGIISLIPYFNWTSWVFAWMDTGRKRYLVYALVYLASYLRSKNLSLSPEESWLPIASIIFCIFHIQLEASIKNGDLKGFQLFGKGKKDLMEDSRNSNEEEREGQKNILVEQEQSQDKLREWGVPKKPSLDAFNLNDDEDDDEGKH